jgi:DNA-binding GntR family transcriptional regulator
MKQFFDFDRRKKDKIVEQVVEQFAAYIHDYKLIHGTPLPNFEDVKKELELTNHEIEEILSILKQKELVIYNEVTKLYLVNYPTYRYDFLVNVAPAYREILNAGKTPKVHTIEKKECIADEDLVHQFAGIKVGERVLHYKRYFTADDVAMFYIEVCFSLEQLPLAGQIFNDDQPHLDLMMQKYPQQYKYHVREVNVVKGPDHLIDIFKPKDKDYICTLGFYRFFNAKGEVVESGFAYMTDLTEFTTTITDLTDLFI